MEQYLQDSEIFPRNMFGNIRGGIIMKFILFFILLLSIHTGWAAPMPMPPSNDGQPHTFSMDEENFLMDGKPVKIISGELHYPRVPRMYWKDRLQRMKAMGINTISTYIFWNAHEQQPGQWDFSENLDFIEFIKEARSEGLWVIVRPGPYICGEWELGGLPAWLLKTPAAALRSSDPAYLSPAMNYLDKVTSMLAPLQITQGGPVIMVQIENEYGSFGSDKSYLEKHLETVKKNLPDIIPFTSDTSVEWSLKYGSLPDVLASVTFLHGADNAFNIVRKVKGKTPQMNSEFWAGWFDTWGKPKYFDADTSEFERDLQWMLDKNTSPNIYMAHGGTTFGFMNGANMTETYAPEVTNYDYGAPIAENGFLTERFFKIRDIIQKYYGESFKLPDPPAQPVMMDLPEVVFTEKAGMFDNLPTAIASQQPQSMEDVGQNYGFILYRTKVKGPGEGQLNFPHMQDRASIYIDGKQIAILDRRFKQNSCQLSVPDGEHTLDILVENMGRINYGRPMLTERKGIAAPVTWNDKEVKNFEIYSLPCPTEAIRQLRFSDKAPAGDQPVFHRSHFKTESPKDTYINMYKGWKKGVVWVNGHNLGRYWFIGSQQTLYCPASFLKQGDNEIVVLELDGGFGSVKGNKEPLYQVRRDPSMAESSCEGKPVTPSRSQRIYQGTFSPGSEEQEILFSSPVTARYIAFKALSSHKDLPYAAIAELNLIDAGGGFINRAPWSIVYADSHETVGESAEADKIMDGQPNTHWHTQWNGLAPCYPHMIVLDLGKEHTLSGFRYLPRQHSTNGRIKDFEIYASTTPFPPGE